MFFQKSTIWLEIEINHDEDEEDSEKTFNDYIMLPQKPNNVLVWW